MTNEVDADSLYCVILIGNLCKLRKKSGGVRIWREEHESMDPSCLVSMVQAGGGVMVWGIFSWHTLDP